MQRPEPWNVARASEIIAGLSGLEGATLPILHALQDAFGHVPDDAVPLVAEALDLSKAEVHGCITFYHDFRRAPAGRHVVKVCRAEACQSVGAERMAADLLGKLAIDWHGTTADGAVTVEPVYCLGLCACGPAVLVDGQPVGRADAEAVLAAIGEGEA